MEGWGGKIKNTSIFFEGNRKEHQETKLFFEGDECWIGVPPFGVILMDS